MGFHVSWIVVRGKTPAMVRRELGLTETDAREFVPESEVTAALLPSGWYMVFFNDLMAAELEDHRLAELSRGADVMMFVVEEASMVSLARGFAGGQRAWEVVHDSSHGLEHLDCPRRPNFDHPCRLNVDQGWKAARSAAVCG